MTNPGETVGILDTGGGHQTSVDARRRRSVIRINETIKS
jgi:hypothetical protein